MIYLTERCLDTCDGDTALDSGYYFMTVHTIFNVFCFCHYPRFFLYFCLLVVLPNSFNEKTGKGLYL